MKYYLIVGEASGDLHASHLMAALQRDITACGTTDFAWDKALIGRHDKIFPSGNQHEAWKGTHIMETEDKHYDAALFARLLEGKGEEWTRI